MTNQPPHPPAASRGQWRRWSFDRSRTDRVIAGVAGGLGRRLGVDPVLVRIAFGVLALAGGAGVVAYGLLWAVAPLESEPGQIPRRPTTVQQGVALALITLGVLLLLRSAGLWFGDSLVLPLVLAAAGSAIVWARSDDDQRANWSRLRRHLPDRVVASAASASVSPVRIVVGTLLVAGAVAGFLAANDAVVAARDLVLALVAALIGLVTLFGPWLWRLVDELGEERRRRIRQEERAELAAHLHDSVLQTLTLIQRSADQPRRMVALARRQERELRSWLYGTAGTAQPTSIATALTAVVEDIEAAHGATVEVVVVGDAPLDDGTRAIVAALREACTNAAKHAETPTIDVYLEVDDTEVVAYVRDRGVGFDPATIDDDRQGLRSSVIDRMERNGGRATIRSTPGEGTEVELTLSRRRRATGVQPTRPTEDTAPGGRRP